MPSPLESRTFPIVKKPRLLSALRLRCPHCGETKLLVSGSWVKFIDRCPVCMYRVDREDGYFTGAAWMVTYSVGAVAGFAVGAYVVWKYRDLDIALTGIIPGLAALVAAFIFVPFGKALWLYFDHVFQPLEADDFQP